VQWLAAGTVSEFVPIRVLSIHSLQLLLRRTGHNAELAESISQIDIPRIIERAVADRAARIAEENDMNPSNFAGKMIGMFAKKFGISGLSNGGGGADMGISGMATRIFSSGAGAVLSNWPTTRPAPKSSTFSLNLADATYELQRGRSDDMIPRTIASSLERLRAPGSKVDPIGVLCVEAEVFAGLCRAANSAEDLRPL
jgi:hypothetical protein